MHDIDKIQKDFDKKIGKRKKSNKHIDHTKGIHGDLKEKLIMNGISKERKKIIKKKIKIK